MHRLLLVTAVLGLIVLAPLSACSCGAEEEIPCNSHSDCPLRAQICVKGLCVVGVIADAGTGDGSGTDGAAADSASLDAAQPDHRTADTASIDTATPDGAPLPDAAAADSAPPDVTASDHASHDSSAPDRPAPDTTAPDTAAPDTSVPDTAAPDTAAPDTAAPDSGAPDAALPDTAMPDSATPDTASGTDWWDPAWERRHKLTFDNSGQDEALLDFTVLIRLDSGVVDYDQIQDLGQDIRFVDADGTTPLAHEIEVWDETGQSIVWVRVPAIDALSSSDFIWLYYGNASVGDAQDQAGTWSASYRLVAHMHGGPADSTGNPSSFTTQQVMFQPGLHGLAASFDGAESHVSYLDGTHITDLFATSVVAANSGATLSAWVYKTGAGDSDYPRVLDKSTDTRGAGGWSFPYGNANVNGELWLEKGYSTARGSFRGGAGSSAQDRWISVAVTYVHATTADAPLFYVDGVEQATTTGEAPGGNPNSDVGQNLTLGNRSGVADRSFEGLIDEVRISKGLRSAAWIRAQHLSMTDSFVTYGAEELAP